MVAMTVRELLDKVVTIRSEPHVEGDMLGSILPGSSVLVDDIVYADELGNLWLELFEEEGFINFHYPPNGWRFEIIEALPEDEAVRIEVIHYDDNGKVVTRWEGTRVDTH